MFYSGYVPEQVGCCGFAGDKGFTHPEVNRYALRHLRPQIEKTSGSADIQTAGHVRLGFLPISGITYQSIVYLVDALYKTSVLKAANQRENMKQRFFLNLILFLVSWQFISVFLYVTPSKAGGYGLNPFR